PHPVTGERVPDEAFQVALEKYVNPRKAAWPAADFIVGNPPFIGNKRMRDALGDGYAGALRSTWSDVPESADFVMYWWHAAARKVALGNARRFGLITTNSLTQTFNRRVVERALSACPASPLARSPWCSRFPITLGWTTQPEHRFELHSRLPVASPARLARFSLLLVRTPLPMGHTTLPLIARWGLFARIFLSVWTLLHCCPYAQIVDLPARASNSRDRGLFCR
ncbi:MAG: DNA methyltransferase, partial [Burkholderiaceae bacterium]